MNAFPTIVEYLTKLSYEKNMSWDIKEERSTVIPIVTVITNKALGEIEKAKVEVYGIHHNGQAKYVFKTVLKR